jgi:septal ring factor EnvC (AmiA/AmiB activator)
LALFEDIRSGEQPIPRGGSPLPWLLLFVLAVGWAATFVLASGRLSDERLRNANALKANDELKSRYEKMKAEHDDLQKANAALDEKRAALETKRDELKAQLTTCTEDLEQAKKPPPKRR